MKKIALLFAVAGLSAPAFATNGMNLAGYGPVSESMGGVSAAYDNGTAAMINNPATLGFMASGTSRFDFALGDLMPKVSSNGTDSSAKDFYMPAIGYVRKDGKISWGVGMMAQGGMGTEYSNGQFWGNMQSFGAPVFTALNAAAQNSLKNMSEVGVGRLIFPVAYQATDAFTVAGSIDYVWAGMDAKWLIDGAHFQDMVTALGGKQIFGTASGSLVNTMLATPGFAGLGYGYFDFEKSGKFGQQAKGDGWAGNIGFTYKVSPQFTVGGVYHAKTNLSDLKTSDGGATMTMAAAILPVPGAFVQPVAGKVTIHNFQWPETYSIGMSYQPSAQWMVNADYKRINWSGVFKSLSLTFESNGAAGNGAFGNKSLDIDYFQRWNDQNVLELGAAYKYNDALTIRFGTNLANNPIPDQYVSPLFPAIAKSHYTVGFGYAFSKLASLDASYVYTPSVSVTNNWSAAGGSNQSISMGGSSWQVMYSHRF